MKKEIIYLTSILAIYALFAGCLPEKAETALTYHGPTVVEIKNFTLGQVSTALSSKGVYTGSAQTDSTHTVLLNSRGTDSVLVQLVGPQSSSPIDITYNVRSASTAIENTNYSFNPAGARKITFAPNTSQAYILINMVPNSLTTVGDSRTIAIDLVGNGNIAPNPNFKTFIITIRR